MEPVPKSGERSEAARLLLVEGNTDTRVLLVADLESDGFKVTSAGSGEEGLDLLATVRPDLIVCGLPGASGYEFLRRVRELEGMDSVPAFAVGAAGREENARRAREAGSAGCSTKPVDPRAPEGSSDGQATRLKSRRNPNRRRKAAV
jgi:two-component system phosphate regulon response regulator PhoB